MLLFISGSYPNSPDGIAASAKILLESMCNEISRNNFVLLTTNLHEIVEYTKLNPIAKTEYLPDWKINVRNIEKFFSILKESCISTIHMEYPGTGYGKTFLATILPFLVKCNPRFRHIKFNVRLHEFTKARLLRKIAILPIVMFADNIYVPALHDRMVLSRIAGSKVKGTIIGNNIPVTSEIKKRNSKICISYFGFVYKGKGIKKMLGLWKKIHDRDVNEQIRFKIIGELNQDGSSSFAEFHKQVFGWIREYGLENYIDITGYVSDEEASREINQTDIATVFYDDGLTLRRGSFIAFLCHGVPIITSCGDAESIELFKSAAGVLMTDSDDEAVERVYKWITLSEAEKSELSRSNKKMAEYFSWKNIALNFLKEYDMLD